MIANSLSLIVVSTHSTGIPEATVYAGQVFYQRADKMRFAAAKDLNALIQVFIFNFLPLLSRVDSSLKKNTTN